MDEAPAPAMAKLKVAGAWSGTLEVALDACTVQMLRAEVAHRSNGGCDPTRINLICGGKVLRDGDSTLLQLGLKNNGKVLATLIADARNAMEVEQEAKKAKDQEDHANKLTRIWEAAKSMAKRHSDGSFPLNDYNIELEDQNGKKVMFGSESDRRALMMGLMLHANAKGLLKKENYKDALDVLTMAEEAFSLCDEKFLQLIDNVPMLQLDMVWCYFMLKDISCLTVAGTRLARTRKGFESSHGKDSTRFRALQAGRQADLAIYLKLELLEGVVAYHNGDFEKAQESISSAQIKFNQLQVPDEALSLLMSMGYKERSAKRALRLTGQDVQSAVGLLVEEREKKTRRIEENLQRRDEIMEQKRYGKTPNNKAVDMEKLKELASIGFERYLVAEALRINENDMEKALDVLTDPEKNCALQSTMESKRKRSTQTTDVALFPAALLDQAVPTTSNLQQGGPSSAPPAPDLQQQQLVENPLPPPPHVEEARDAEMEDELANELRGDALADYDIDVTKEGEALSEYATLLSSVLGHQL
ncbi:NEDD8 ultimate buster 1 [Rhynchospora pubera]|uniref:NEDD8 ultimate buster 1 n=1 Tax=Rhynchospora pubera TaxID=906938 RepID=A0AAV8HCZ3_9POAL|nr:NEDD8 ultimate buster 1 [Rhynchospora pubera]